MHKIYGINPSVLCNFIITSKIRIIKYPVKPHGILNEEKLFVKTCFVDEGIVMKRAKMDSRGHVGRNDHKTSHITIVVSELNK